MGINSSIPRPTSSAPMSMGATATPTAGLRHKKPKPSHQQQKRGSSCVPSSTAVSVSKANLRAPAIFFVPRSNRTHRSRCGRVSSRSQVLERVIASSLLQVVHLYYFIDSVIKLKQTYFAKQHTFLGPIIKCLFRNTSLIVP